MNPDHKTCRTLLEMRRGDWNRKSLVKYISHALSPWNCLRACEHNTPSWRCWMTTKLIASANRRMGKAALVGHVFQEKVGSKTRNLSPLSHCFRPPERETQLRMNQKQPRTNVAVIPYWELEREILFLISKSEKIHIRLYIGKPKGNPRI